jgi:F-type H+-transporting ATPase subunit a
MNITPDAVVLGHLGPLPISHTLVYTWVVMALLVGLALWGRRHLGDDQAPAPLQNVLEAVVELICDQLRDIAQEDPSAFLPFVGTLFVFIATCNLLGAVPGFEPPTASLSTTTALALAVFVAVPWFGIRRQGLIGYLKDYLQPTPLMLPLHVLGELSRTLALAVRLFGNIMSDTVIIAILLSVAPLIFPVLLHILGLITGLLQAYIFAVLAMVYIAAGTGAHPSSS